jgi:hypothetical protein
VLLELLALDSRSAWSDLEEESTAVGVTSGGDSHKRQPRNQSPTPEQVEERFTLDVEPEEALKRLLAGAGTKKRKPDRNDG